MCGREPDPPRDLAPPALLVAVQDADRHQVDAVRDSGEAEAVVGRLRDRARDVSAMTLGIERDVVAVDEVPGMDEPLRDWEIGIAPVLVAVLAVGEAGVEDGDGDALRAGTMRRDEA